MSSKYQGCLVTNGNVPFLFFFHPKDMTDIRYLLKSHTFDRPRLH